MIMKGDIMSKPLSDKLDAFLDEEAISLHVPGHKNMTIGNLDQQLSFKKDMTEITGLDDLHHPEEIILKSMETINKHKDYTAYFLVNGTTSGILSVIQAFSTLPGKYIVARDAHKSVFHGLDLANATATLLEMKLSEMTNQYVGPNVKAEIKDFEDGKLGIFTYPNYYGECFDVQTMINRFKEKEIPVLIDEAHGAHFDLNGFPTSSLNMGADYVVQSYHKTLPSLTMGSVIFIHKNAPLKEMVLKYMTYFQTSSPSYLIMSSLELAQRFYENYDSDQFYSKRAQLVKKIKARDIEVLEVEDNLKLIIRCPGYTGYELQQLFEEKGIYVELADAFQTLVVLPLWHSEDRFPFDTLLNRINEIKVERREPIETTKVDIRLQSGKYYSGIIEKTRWIDIDKAENEILGNDIVPYPPGIPVMFKGETVTQNMIKLMNYWYAQHVRVEGIKKHKIEVKDE